MRAPGRHSSSVEDDPDGGPDNQQRGLWSRVYLRITVANLTIAAVVGSVGGLSLVAACRQSRRISVEVALLPGCSLATSRPQLAVGSPAPSSMAVRCACEPSASLGSWLSPVHSRGRGGTVDADACSGAHAPGVWRRTRLRCLDRDNRSAYPHKLRPRAFAAQSVMFGAMGLGGPALAGIMLALGGWRIVFVVQLPLIMIALATGWVTLPTTRDRPARIQTDWRGTGLLVLLIVCSLTAVSQVGVRWWAVAAAMAATAVVARMYWRHSGRVDEPVLARAHLTRFPLMWIHAISGLAIFIAIASDNFLPLYVQTARGRSVEFAAFTLVFLAVGWTAGSLAYSRLLNDWRESEVIRLGCRLLFPSLVLAGTTVALVSWPLPVLFGALTFIGVSLGLVSTAGLTLLQANGEQAEMGPSVCRP